MTSPSLTTSPAAETSFTLETTTPLTLSSIPYICRSCGVRFWTAMPSLLRVGSDSVLECVGTQESMAQVIGSTRPGGSIGYVGVPHGVELDGADLFFRHVRLHGGPAPVRRYLPDLIRLRNGQRSGFTNAGDACETS